jgi:hypothetical protein
MLDIQDASIRTAGAYLCINGLYVFAIGNQLHNGSIPVFRLGGHREDFDPRLTLEPFAQLHLLSRILGMPAENKSA